MNGLEQQCWALGLSFELTRSDIAHRLDQRGFSDLVAEPPSGFVNRLRKGPSRYMSKFMGTVAKFRHWVYDAIWLCRSQAVQDLRDKPLAIVRRGIHCHWTIQKQISEKRRASRRDSRYVQYLSDATPTYTTILKMQVHRTVQEYNIIRPIMVSQMINIECNPLYGNVIVARLFSKRRRLIRPVSLRLLGRVVSLPHATSCFL